MGYDIVAIGAALLDATISVDESFLSEHGLKKGHMDLINEAKCKELVADIEDLASHATPGGSAANVLSAANSQGAKTLLIGVIGEGALGEKYKSETEAEGVSTHLATHTMSQGIAVAFITPDGERTFATYLGATTQLQEEDLDKEAIANAKVLHIEAFKLDSARDVIFTAMDIAKKNDVLISIDVADPSLIKRHEEDINLIIKTYADIIFANEDESLACTGLPPEAAAKKLQKDVPLSIVKIGAEGSIIASDKGITKISGVKVKVVNTNGAGDTFAGVFIAQYLQEKNLQEAGNIASTLAAKVVGSANARLNL